MNFMPPNTDLSFSGLEEFVNERIVSGPTVKKHVVETSEAKTTKAKPKVIRKNNGAPIIEDWVSDSEEENVPQLRFKRKMETQDMPVRPMLVGFGNQRTKVIDHVSKHNNASTILKSGCSRHMTGNMSYLTEFEEIDRGYVAFGGNPKGGKISDRGQHGLGRLLLGVSGPSSQLKFYGCFGFQVHLGFHLLMMVLGASGMP
ncbi:hypothetical protein Tco_0215326 [Tanacetum coccineum]